MSIKKHAKTSLALGLALGLIGSLSSPAWADVCDSQVKSADPALAAQKQEYCGAAHSAKLAARDQGILWKVWGAVASVCSYACIKSLVADPASPLLCTGASVAAGLTDGVMTKNFSGALMAIGTAAVGGGFSHGGQSVAGANDGPQATQHRKDWSACMSAATATIQAVSKHQLAQSSQHAYAENLDLARKLKSTGAGADSGVILEDPSPADPGGQAWGGGTGATGGQPASVASASSGSQENSCANAQDNGFQGYVSCATAQDPNLPQFVRSPEFSDEFKKASGQDLAHFLATSDSGKIGPVLGSALGGNLLPAKASEKLGEVVAQLDQAIRAREPGVQGTAYAQSGGGGSHAAHEDSGPDFNSILKGVMGQFMPKAGHKAALGVSTASFGTLSRMPASISPEDRKISLFDRVTTRYSILRPQMLEVTGGAR